MRDEFEENIKDREVENLLKSDVFVETVSKIVTKELQTQKLKNTNESKDVDNIANQVKVTLKLEIISKDSSKRRDYKLTPNTKFEHFFDFFTSELGTLELLHIVDSEISKDKFLNDNILEKQKYKVRDILINRLDQIYHSKVINLKDPVEILNNIRELRKCESNFTSTTLRKLL